MKYTLHSSTSRGYVNHGWLKTYLTFSFGSYFNRERMHFGNLRVFNDDLIDAEMGFDFHPHKNMEIITIVLEGELHHQDSMGHSAIIRSGDIQVMSAGTGLLHSEFNKNKKTLSLLQIWMIPNQKDVAPRYDQISLPPISKNTFQKIISPYPNTDGLWIYQEAWFYLGNFTEKFQKEYIVKKDGNGIYLFVIEGELVIPELNIHLHEKDGIGLWDTEKLSLCAKTDSRFLLMDVPMKVV